MNDLRNQIPAAHAADGLLLFGTVELGHMLSLPATAPEPAEKGAFFSRRVLCKPGKPGVDFCATLG